MVSQYLLGWLSPTAYPVKLLFPCMSLLPFFKKAPKGTFLDMLREKLRLMMLRDVTMFSTSSLVLSVPYFQENTIANLDGTHWFLQSSITYYFVFCFFDRLLILEYLIAIFINPYVWLFGAFRNLIRTY